MPDVDGFPPGIPSWVDLASPDQDASAAFYGELLGWDCNEAAEDDSAGGYRIFTLRGRPVAGLGVQQEGAPPVWTTYVGVDDAEDAAAKIRDAGGSVLLEPMDVMEAGRMAVFTDTSGAHFAVWQPKDHAGVGIVNEPGALTWNELATRDPEGAKGFYSSVFGWDAEPQEGPPGAPPYAMWRIAGGEKPVGGMITMTDEMYPAEVPPHWLTYLQVADCAAATERARELGSTVIVESMEIPIGRFSVLSDPQGATVAFFEASEA